MRAITFQYAFYKGRFAPIIPAEFLGPQGWVRIWTYVDSGASFTILGSASAERIGLKWDKGQPTNIVVGDGGLMPVFTHRIPVRIGKVQIPAHVGFSPRLGVGFNLLGRQDIFTHFDVTFSDSRRLVSFKPVR